MSKAHQPKAIGYVRISQQQQSHYSLDSQESAIRHYCEVHGFRLVRLFREDGKSAKTTDRPQLNKLMQYAAQKRNGVKFVVFDKVDRIAREQLGFHTLWAWFSTRSIGVRVVSQAIEEDSPHGKMVAGMLAAVAEYDNALRSERVKTNMKAAAQKGRWVWSKPTGYIANPTRDPSMIPDPKVAPLVTRAFELMASGLYRSADVQKMLHRRSTASSTGASATSSRPSCTTPRRV